MLSKLRLLCAVFAIITSQLLWISTASSEERDPKAELKQLYNRLLENPSDINMNLQYADLAIEMKDYEAAIPPLERILFYNPSLVDTKLKLGILYYLLGSYDVAKSYLETVRQASAATKETTSKADEYLKKIEQVKSK